MKVLPGPRNNRRLAGWVCLLLPVMLAVICAVNGLLCRTAAAAGEGENVVVSYILTDKDLANLKTDYDISDELSQLQSQTFETREKYESAANSIVESAPDEYKEIISRHLKEPERATTYKLTDQSLINLEAASLPKDILEKIKSLIEKIFADSKTFYTAVFTIVPEQTENYLQQIIKQAEVRSYKLTDKFFEYLQNEKFPKTITEDLQKLRGQEFGDIKDLLNEIKKRIEDEAAIQQVYDYYQKYYRTEPSKDAGQIVEIIKYQLSEPSLVALKNNKLPESIVDGLRSLKIVDEIYTDRKEFIDKIKPLIDKEEVQFKKYRAMIFAAAEKSIRYRLGENAAKTIVDELSIRQLPDKFIQKLTEMKGIEYPDENVFRSEARLKIGEALQQYESTILSAIDTPAPFQLSPQILDNLAQVQMPERLVRELETLQGISFKDKTELAERLSAAFQHIPAQYLPLLVKQARKEHAYVKYAEERIKLKGDACDCYRDDFTGTIYGFYPFWMSRSEQEGSQAQKLDFSVLSRIGFYALPVDAQGDLKQGARWEKQETLILKTAHKYRTKVDLVVYSADWSAWAEFSPSRDNRKTKEFAENIVNSLRRKKHRWIHEYFDGQGLPVIDGITIDIGGFPMENLSLFIEMVEELKQLLLKTNEDYHVNIIIPDQDINKIVEVLTLFKTSIPDQENEYGPVDYFFVFLEEPTTVTKKTLRSEIEKEFKGIKRRNMVRSIIPVISPHGHNQDEFRQFFDDLIYFEDNYGGVGFWPLPVVKTEYEKNVNAQIRKVFDKNFGRRDVFDRLIAPVCKIVCPNRLIFHAIWYIFLAILFAAVVLFYWVCRVRTFINEYFILFFIGIVFPLVTLGLTLLFCDPSYQRIAEGNGPLIFILLGIIIFSILQYRRKKKQTENP